MSANLLHRETSPYLLQHKDNPVHWQPWGEAALALAKRDNKPILLSVGYAACHWCHVMAHESFEDPETAALMNDYFVNIKVDREERPDIDAIYQSALALLGQHGGWPLTMFLTPDGEPFWGGTYFPSEDRFGRPSFRDVLRRLHQVYSGDPDAVAKNRSALREALDKLSEPPPDAPTVRLSLELLDAVAEQLAGEIDPRHGGLRGAPKFPHVPAFELLWRAYLRSGSAACRDAVTLTLDRMCQGGIYDHLGGGFARYATDEAWLVPHFEKMLYDNAQLLDLLTLVWQHQRSPLYAQRARETAEWVLREMRAEGGGFAATQDADSEGEEGKFYVWSAADIDELLGADAERFKAAYDVTPGGNWEGRSILNRSARPEPLSEAEEAELAALRQVLWRHREGRVKPGWDDKVLADWNGQMIAALAAASAAFEEPRWLAAARAAFAFVCEHMSMGERLCHSYRQGRPQPVALLDDYANMARAALTLFEVTGEDPYLSRARAWVEVVERHYRDPRHGGYYYTADDAEGLITRTRNAADNAVPAGNGTLAGVLARLYHLTGEARYRERAATTIAAFAAEVARNFISLATLLNAFELLESGLQIVIVGARGEAATEALLGVVHGAALPNRVLQVAADGAALPADHPAHGKGRLEGAPAAYLCLGATCSLPLSEPEALRAALPGPPGEA